MLGASFTPLHCVLKLRFKTVKGALSSHWLSKQIGIHEHSTPPRFLFYQTEIRNHFSTATYSLIVHQLLLMNNVLEIFHALSAINEVPVAYRWLPPTGDYSICHFSLSFFPCPSLPLIIALSYMVLAQCR